MNALSRRFALPLISSCAFVALLAGLGQPLEAAAPVAPEGRTPTAQVTGAVEAEAAALKREAARMRWLVTLPSVSRRRCAATC